MMFAGDLRVPMERNTREEEDVLDGLRRHYNGVMEKFEACEVAG